MDIIYFFLPYLIQIATTFPIHNLSSYSCYTNHNPKLGKHTQEHKPHMQHLKIVFLKTELHTSKRKNIYMGYLIPSCESPFHQTPTRA